MGIYIPKMKLPESCWHCDPDFGIAIKCKAWESMGAEFIKERAPGCPLIEVSEPHGRLIDADALRPSFIEEYETSDVFVYRYYTEEDLASAPTIIESEGGNE